MAESASNVTIDDVVIDNQVLYESILKSFKRDPFDHYVHGICGLSICLLGIISNAFSFSILIRRTMRLSTYVYLAGLCLSDFTACLFLIPGFILATYPVEVPDFDLPRTYTYTRVLIIAGAISTTARALSVWLCVAFTIDRWIMICRPFVGPLYCTIRNARLVTAILYIIGVLYAVPLMFEYEAYEERPVSELLFFNHKRKIYHQKLSEMGKNTTFRWIYALINAIIVYLIPLTIIAILNRKLLLSIRRLEQRSQEYNAPLPTKQGVTAMLLATTINLLVFRSPSAIVSVMWLIRAKIFINDTTPFRWRKFHSIANICATFNAATTFILFIIYGTKFRSEFTRIYCCLFRRLKKETSTVTRENQEYQPMHERLDNDHRLQKNNSTQSFNQSNDKCKLTIPSDRSFSDTYVNLSPNNPSIATCTTSPSSALLMPKRHSNSQQQSSCPLTSEALCHDMNQSSNGFTNGTESHLNEQNGTKSMLLVESYYDWLKKLVVCR